MSGPTSLFAYQPEIKALERAYENSKGIRIEMGDISKAYNFRNRLNYARSLDRRKNMETYDPGMPLYGRSIYDTLKISIREDEAGNHWIYIEKNEEIPGYVEDLGEAI